MSATAASAAAADTRDGNTTPPTTDQLANAPTPDSAGQGVAAAEAGVLKQPKKPAAIPAAEQKQKSRGDHAALLAKLKTQIEFYFSTQNLQNDPFLVSKMNAEKFVPISVIANFRKVSELTTDVSLIAQAVRGSNVCSIDDTGTMLKPTSMKFQERNTIILREISSDATEEELRALFNNTSGCGKVVSLRSDIGNTWFVTMESEDAARDSLLALKSSGKGFKGKPIRGGLKSKSVARSSFAPSAVDAPAFVPGQGFVNSKPVQIKTFTPAAAQLPPGTATAMARYYNMTPEQMKQALATNPYFAAQVYAYTTALAMQGMGGGNGGTQQGGGYRAVPYGNKKDGKYGSNNRRTSTNNNSSQRGQQQGQPQRRQQTQHSNSRKGGSAASQQQNSKKLPNKDAGNQQQNKKNKGGVGVSSQDSKPSKGSNKATTSAAAAAAAAKKAVSVSKDGSSSAGGSSSSSPASPSSSSSSVNGQNRQSAKQHVRTAGVGRAPAHIGNNNHNSNNSNPEGGNSHNKNSNGNSTSSKSSTNSSGNYNTDNNNANKNNGKSGNISDKKSKKAAAAASAAESATKAAPVVPNVTSTSMFPSLGGKSGSVPAATKSAATSLWSASAAVKQKPASSKLRQMKSRQTSAAMPDEAGNSSSSGKKKKNKGSSSAASGKAGSARVQASGEISKTSSGSRSDTNLTSASTTTTAIDTSSAPAPFSWAATVAKTANKPVREKKEKPAAKPTWGSEAAKRKKGKMPSSPNTKAAVTAIVDSVVDSVASAGRDEAVPAATVGEPSSVVATFKSPTRKKSPVTSWADEADTDDEDDLSDFTFSGSGTSPKKKRAGGLAAALSSRAKSVDLSPDTTAAAAAVSPRRGWESASVTKHRGQIVRAGETSENSSGSSERSASSNSARGAWADVVKRADGTSPSGPSSSQFTAKAREGAWNTGAADSGSSTTTAGSEPSESDNSWADRSDAPVLPVNTRAALFASATGAQPAKREPREDNSSWGDATR